MKRLIGGLLLGASLFTGPMTAHAEGVAASAVVIDEAAVKLQLSRRFIAALQTDQMASMLGQMTVAFAPAMENLSETQQAAVQNATAAATAEMTLRLFDAMAPIYADIFTLEELSGLVTFYESDIGRSMMAKSYTAAPRITALVMEMMPEMMEGMADSMCKDLGCTAEERARMTAAMDEAGHASAAPSGASAKTTKGQ